MTRWDDIVHLFVAPAGSVECGDTDPVTGSVCHEHGWHTTCRDDTDPSFAFTWPTAHATARTL